VGPELARDVRAQQGPLSAVGCRVFDVASVLCWPLTRREVDDEGLCEGQDTRVDADLVRAVGPEPSWRPGWSEDALMQVLLPFARERDMETRSGVVDDAAGPGLGLSVPVVL
jgi:hypothetical protein